MEDTLIRGDNIEGGLFAEQSWAALLASPLEGFQAEALKNYSSKSNAILSKGLELQLVENESCICHEGTLVIPKPCATIWYHHYLQHPGHNRLEETMKAVIYWTGMRTTIRSITKSCKTCQINKKRSLKYGHLPSKIVICTPWEALCVDLIGPYTLKGKDGSSIDFMALTMIVSVSHRPYTTMRRDDRRRVA